MLSIAGMVCTDDIIKVGNSNIKLSNVRSKVVLTAAALHQFGKFEFWLSNIVSIFGFRVSDL